MPTGPSTTQTPYILPSLPNVRFSSILSAGDTVAGAPTPFVGVPDGIGVFDNGDGTATVVLNHELAATAGAVRAHGSTGSFVDRLVINTSTLQVVSEKDAASSMFLDPDGDGVWTPGTSALERLCSGDLAAVSAFFQNGVGTQDRIYLTGEETSPPFTPDNGRAFAFVLTGTDAGKAFELPRMGQISFENLVASPASSKTVSMMQDDAGNGSTTGGQVYMYVGTRQNTGNTVDRAGLTNGQLYGVKVAGLLDEANNTTLTGDIAAFSLVNLPNAATETGIQLQADSEAGGVTEFLRPEDGAWDPSHPNWYYFNTTANVTGNSRIWRLEFSDINNPTAGGTIHMMLDGSEGHRMLDNLTVAADGTVYALEDVGNNSRLGLVWKYDPVADTMTQLGTHDAARFGATPTAPFNQDEEASGIIDVTGIFGNANRAAYLLDTQAHYAFTGPNANTVVEGGQLQIMFVDSARNGNPGNGGILWQNDNGQMASWQLNGTTLVSGTNVGTNPGPSWHLIGPGDFNGDGRGDALWQNDNGQAAVWLMNGTSVTSGNDVGFNPGKEWHVIGSGDFNGDNRSDILWQSDSGQAAVWLMDGQKVIGAGNVGTSPGASWHALAAGDFNGDGKDDILWQNDNGQAAVWQLNGLNLIAGANVGVNPGSAWNVQAAADFNGDGKADILWQHDNGQAAIWLMNGSTVTAGQNVGFNPGPAWDIQRAGDFNADGKADILWQNDNGQAAVWLMNGFALQSGADVGANPGTAWNVIPQHHDLF
jgi:hypothetical protein